MANTIANSTAGNTFFTMGGSAITSTTQPRQNFNVLANVLDSSLTSHPADSGVISTSTYTVYTGFDDTSIIRGLSNTIQGVANTAIRNPGSNFHRESIHQVDAVRSRLVASSIRSGYWNFYSGGWSTTPPTTNDFSAFGTDREAASNRALPGYFAYQYGGSGVRDNYNPRTQ